MYTEHNSIFYLPSYVEDHSRHLDSSWTASGAVQISGLGGEAQCTELDLYIIE